MASKFAKEEEVSFRIAQYKPSLYLGVASACELTDAQLRVRLKCIVHDILSPTEQVLAQNYTVIEAGGISCSYTVKNEYSYSSTSMCQNRDNDLIY